MAFLLAIKDAAVRQGRMCSSERLPERARRADGLGRPSLQNRLARLTGDGFGDARLAWGDAVLEEAAGGEEFGVEQGGAGGTADQVVREER